MSEHNNPLPAATVVVTCDECSEQLAELKIGLTSLMTEIFKARREHAKAKHGWDDARGK